jgi:hypothetical protein
VTSREELENEHVQIQTEHEAKDDNKKAAVLSLDSNRTQLVDTHHFTA